MNKVECKLSCGHSVRLTVNADNARESEPAYCRFDGWQTVEQVFHTEYRIICPDCPYGRWCGQNRKQAWREANSHAYLRGGHRTFVVLDTVTKQGGGQRKDFIASHFTTANKSDTVVSTPAEPLPPPF